MTVADGSLKKSKVRDSDGAPKAKGKLKAIATTAAADATLTPLEAAGTVTRGARASEGTTGTTVEANTTSTTSTTTAAATTPCRSKKRRVRKQTKNLQTLPATARVQPTVEFLKTEGDKLATAASAINCFLLPNAQAAPPDTVDTTTPQPFLLSVPLATFMGPAVVIPRREKAREASGKTAKLTHRVSVGSDKRFELG